jgi:hypothetical protein
VTDRRDSKLRARYAAWRWAPSRSFMALVVAALVALQAGVGLAGASGGGADSPRITSCVGYSLKPSDASRIPAIVRARPAGTVFCFAPGTYRMTGTIVAPNYDRFIGTGDGRGLVVLTGSKVLSGWTASGGLYVHGGDVVSLPRGGICAAGSACRYSDWLFRDRRPLRRVLSPCTAAKVGTWGFCVDYGARKIYVRATPAGHAMSYSYVPHALAGGTGVVVRNMTFDKYANTVGGVSVLRATNNWLVDDIAMQYSHGCAIALAGTTGTVVRNSRFHNNGQFGYCGSPRGALFANNEVDHNNFLGIRATWGGGGGKFTNSVNVTVANNYVHNNNGNGIWLDFDSRGAIIKGNRSTKNSGKYGGGNGITYEVSCYGAILSNVSSGNGMAGIQLRNSHHNTVGGAGIGNSVSNNVIAGIRVIADQSGTQRNCGAVTGNYNRIMNNSITMPRGASLNGVQNWKPGVARGNSFTGNDYHMPGTCSPRRWWWWDGRELLRVPFWGTGKTWRGTFKQDLAPGGTCQ